MRSILSQYSLFTRRVVALGLLVFVMLLAWNILLSPLFGAVQSGLSELNDARYQRMRLEQIEARPSPEQTSALPPQLIVEATTVEEASTAFTAHFSNLASREAVELGNFSQSETGGTGRLVRLEFTAFGREEQIARFINAAENSAPAIRFRNWRIEANETSTSEFLMTGQALAAWSKP